MACTITGLVRNRVCLHAFSLALFAAVAVAQDGGAAGIPTNNDCRDRITVTNGNTPFDTVGATTDGEEDFTLCFTLGDSNVQHDIWYRYVATCDGALTVNLCNSNFDTKVAVYEGCDCLPPAPPLGCNDDDETACPGDPGPSHLTVPVEQEGCYMIRVGGYFGDEGTGTMNLSCNVVVPQGACCNTTGGCLGTMSQVACSQQSGIWHQGQNCSSFVCPIPPPPNDECSNAQTLTTGVADTDGTTLGATGSVSTCALNDTKDVWHKWTATCTGIARFSTCGSTFDTTVSAFMACGGMQMACADDGCSVPLQSNRGAIELHVDEGTTYFIRVAGRLEATGDYDIVVEPCLNACCINGGFRCQNIPEAQCLNGGGALAGPGAVCLLDGNANGINDACEDSGCPAATIDIEESDPPSGTVDARQPYPQVSPTLRQGIGAPGGGGVLAEPIHLTLSPPVAGAEGCFQLCETGADPVYGPNAIGPVVYHGGGMYQITLTRAITAGEVTTIEYTGDGSFVRYTAHPANVDSSGAALPSDIIELIDNINGVRRCPGTQTLCPLTKYQCDLDRSSQCLPADIITLIDLLTGVGSFDPWNGSPLPTITGCP